MKVMMLSVLIFVLAVAGNGCQPAAPAPESVRLRSAAIREAAYDRPNQALSVVFPNGTRYVYAPVPEQTFAALRESPSPGRYFNTQIKTRYAARRVTAPAPR